MRHAKSSWSIGASDQDRPLSLRGRRDGRVAGAWLTARGICPDLLVVSPAARTRQTADRLASGGVSVGRIDILDALSATSSPDLLSLLRTTPGDVRTLMVVGHNPTVEDAVRLLARRAGNEAWWASIDAKFPTSAIAVIGFDGEWAQATSGTGTLLAYAVPRG